MYLLTAFNNEVTNFASKTVGAGQLRPLS